MHDLRVEEKSRFRSFITELSTGDNCFKHISIKIFPVGLFFSLSKFWFLSLEYVLLRLKQKKINRRIKQSFVPNLNIVQALLAASVSQSVSC